MSFGFANLPDALRMTEGGAIRVGRTRVTLDTLAALFAEGAAPEEAVVRFPSLTLADVYEGFTYLIREPTEAARYLRLREEEAEELQAAVRGREGARGLRAKLLKRAQRRAALRREPHR